MGRQSIWEYFRSVYARYRQAAREVKRKILDGSARNATCTCAFVCGLSGLRDTLCAVA